MIRWAELGDFHLTIRLVKGAYWDQEVIVARQKNWPVPVFTDKSETDANFERLARIILENRGHVKLACASHNIRSISAVSETARESGATRGASRISGPLRYGAARSKRSSQSRPASPCLLPGRRNAARDFIPCEETSGEHGESILPEADLFSEITEDLPAEGPGSTGPKNRLYSPTTALSPRESKRGSVTGSRLQERREKPKTR